jgi:Co/Zn/Cd efflux system component
VTSSTAGSSRPPGFSRLIRRETHSPRSASSVTLAIVLIVLFAWLGTEIMLALTGSRALLAAPGDMVGFLVAAQAEYPAAFGAAGIAAALVGLVLIVAAIGPGRRARHELLMDRPVVVDNEVIASALARRAATVARVDPDNCTVSVSHRRAIVHVTPTSGQPIDRDAVLAAVTEQLESFELRPPVTARLVVAEQARVGA